MTKVKEMNALVFVLFIVTLTKTNRKCELY